MTPIVLVILVSLGSFQATFPGMTKVASPTFEDNGKGLALFTDWASSNLGVPKFNQPPLQVCVVGSVKFKEEGPYIAKPIWESQAPIHKLEPYSATFHYVETPSGTKPPKPRTMKQAIDLCQKVAAK